MAHRETLERTLTYLERLHQSLNPISRDTTILVHLQQNAVAVGVKSRLHL